MNFNIEVDAENYSLISALRHNVDGKQELIDQMTSENVKLTGLLRDIWQRRYGTGEGFDTWLEWRLQ